MLEALGKKVNLVCLVALGLIFALGLHSSRSPWMGLNFLLVLPLVATICAYTVKPGSWVVYFAMGLNALAASSVLLFAWVKLRGTSPAGTYSAGLLLGLLFLPAAVNVIALIRRVRSADARV